MYHIALKMLGGDRTKFITLILGVTFTAFLVTFAVSYFCGFMTRGFALISETQGDIWVMDAAVSSVEQTTNLSDAALLRVRSVPGVAAAIPLLLSSAEVRFPNGSFQSFQVIGVDDSSLAGLPRMAGLDHAVLRQPGQVVVDDGGTEDKLVTPLHTSDTWPSGGRSNVNAAMRRLARNDQLELNDHRIRIAGVSNAHPRYPAKPLMYMTLTNARHILPSERRQISFILVRAGSDNSMQTLATRIEQQTGLKARTAADFKTETVHWYLRNSEDVGDVMSMLILAIAVGFGVTGVMLYMFTSESLQQYAVLSALGTLPSQLLKMVFLQAMVCGLSGAGMGTGLCALADLFLRNSDYPFRMMWFAPLAGGGMVMLTGVIAAIVSARPVLKLEPAKVFAAR
ncbi:ABC transporter permease [Undibacterium sp. WLX3042]|uniref:ABC transporter permease n=1 Tax=Undibacterium sp. WLX3042 TaxID=3412686 RepID=UPI003C2F34A0